MTLRDDMKREKDDFWAQKERLITITIDIIKSALAYSQHARNYSLDRLYIKLTKESLYEDEYFVLHVSIGPDFRVTEIRSLSYLTAESKAVADRILSMIAKKLEEEGFTAIKFDGESGSLTAEIDLT